MIKNRWIKQLVSNNMKSGFFSNLSAGTLQIISYIFVALRAAAGALTAGAVVKYAGIIYRFSQSVTNVFNTLEEYAVSSNRQLSTLEYLNIKDVLKKARFPWKNAPSVMAATMNMKLNSGMYPSNIPAPIPAPCAIST